MTLLRVLLLTIAALALMAGCGRGKKEQSLAPEPMRMIFDSPEEAKAYYDNLTPAQRAAYDARVRGEFPHIEFFDASEAGKERARQAAAKGDERHVVRDNATGRIDGWAP
jgi:hypothetical protein